MPGSSHRNASDNRESPKISDTTRSHPHLRPSHRRVRQYHEPDAAADRGCAPDLVPGVADDPACERCQFDRGDLRADGGQRQGAGDRDMHATVRFVVPTRSNSRQLHGDRRAAASQLLLVLGHRHGRTTAAGAEARGHAVRRLRRQHHGGRERRRRWTGYQRIVPAEDHADVRHPAARHSSGGADLSWSAAGAALGPLHHAVADRAESRLPRRVCRRDGYARAFRCDRVDPPVPTSS